ncbi:hypothetical protein [Paenibacillus medicaginis]|uniref:Uncharacterized protein n=1 Tax=Paenibacillus medicaginis TaxID=1470560 RepID=A0ABV5BYA4_9BACL
MNNDNGLTTIDEARRFFEDFYDDANILKKVELKCWINHSESRNKNNNIPFTYYNYINHMSVTDYIHQINLRMINVDDLGRKEFVVNELLNGR